MLLLEWQRLYEHSFLDFPAIQMCRLEYCRKFCAQQETHAGYNEGKTGTMKEWMFVCQQIGP